MVYKYQHPAAHEALQILAKQIDASRRKRGLTEQQLADLAGINRLTIRKILKGQGNVAIGTVFHVAALCSVSLFHTDEEIRRRESEHLTLSLALLPSRIVASTTEVDDDF